MMKINKTFGEEKAIIIMKVRGKPKIGNLLLAMISTSTTLL
jgi:hypothetical protein